MDISKLQGAFREALDIDGDIEWKNLRYNEYQTWTSLGHMALVASIENQFDIMFETDDILEMSSFDKAVEIVSKYVDHH